MTPEHILTNYADLLDTGADPATLTLLADLDALYAPPVPQRAATPFSRLLAQPTSTSSVQPSSPPLLEGGAPSGPRAGGWGPPVSGEQPRPGNLRQWLAFAAAALAFALVGALLIVLFRGQQDDGPRTAAPIPPATSSEVRDILYVSQVDETHRAIQSVRSDGGEPSTILDGSGATVWWPTWSPDGTRIAFSSSMDGPFSIYTTNAAGGDLQRLTTPDFKMADTEPTWSPNGTHIAFIHTRDIEQGLTDLMVMNADGSDLSAVAEFNEGEGAGTPVWSPDGARIAFAVQSRVGDVLDGAIYVVNADGTGLTQVSTSKGWNLSPAWSPDGTHVAYIHSEDGSTDMSRIYVTDIASGQPRPISTDDSWAGSPDWSPDGSWIAYVATVDEARQSIRVMRPDGTDQQDIATFHGLMSPHTVRWSPDGQQLAYMEYFVDVSDTAARGSLVVIDRNGANRRVLAEDVAIGSQPAWSPLPIDADPPPPTASPSTGTIADQFRAALAALPADQRGCQATPADIDATGLPEIVGRMLVGEGDMVVQIAGAGEGNHNLTVGTQGIFIIIMPESGIARLSITATDPSGAQELAPDWGPQVGSGSQSDGPIWRTLITFPTSGCWQLNVIGEQSAGVAWLQVDPPTTDLGTPTPAALDNLRPLDPGEGWFVRFQIWSDWREDGGALSHWTVERIERVLPDGTRQRHIIAWDDTDAVVAELINDGERWWWNQRGWQESGSLAAGIAPIWLDLRAGMFEPETAVQMLSTTDPVQIEQFTEDDVVITRYRNNTRNINERLNPPVADRYYEIRQSADPPGHVLLTRWVNIDEAGTEIELYRQVFEDFVRTDATAISDAEFAIPAAASDKRQMQYTPPAALPAGFTLDRHWYDFPIGIEQLDISGFGIDVQVDISASRGGFDPRQTEADAAQSGNITHTLETAAGSVTWLSTPDDLRPFLAIWDNDRYRFQLTTSPTDGADWNEEVLRSLVESLADHGLS